MFDFNLDRPFPPERDPDVVLESSEAFELPAEGELLIRTLVLSCAGLEEPAYVEAVRLTFGEGEEAVRHAEIRLDATGASLERDARERLPGFAGRPHYDGVRQAMDLFAAWTPWTSVQTAPEGAAWRIHPQADVVITCYLQPTGRQERIKPRVGLWLRTEEPARKVLTLRLANEGLKLRPGVMDASVRDRFDIPVAVRVHAIYPAGNRLAKSFGLDALGPRERDAKGELVPVEAQRILEIPEWQRFGQEMYRFKQAVELKAGTRLELQIRHDYEPRGPESLQPVGWGSRENDEWSEVYVQLSVEQEEAALRLANGIAHHQLALHIEGLESREDSDLEAHLELAVLYADLGQFKTAAAHGERALSLAPENGRAHAVLGAAHVSQGFFFTAQEHLLKAVELAPEDAAAWYNLGNVYYEYQMTDRARSAFQKAEALNPRDYRAANNLGIVLLGDSKADQARLRFERILRAQPYNAPAMANLARASQMLDRHEEAARLYERAMELSPAMKDSAPVVANLAKAYHRLGRTKDAVRCYERAVELAPALQYEVNALLKQLQAQP